MNLLYERLLLIVLVIILLIAAWCMYDNYYVYNQTLDESIRKYKPVAGSADFVENSPITDDMTAWITIDGTNIDYPVMQGTDNMKYLNTDPFGHYSLSGSIFLDSRNSADFSDDYSLIYGHHMEYGKMFGALDDFLDPPYFAQHRTGTLIIGKNAEKTYALDVFAAMRADSRDGAVFDPGKADIKAFIRKNAEICIADRDERIVGLSTCTEGSDNSRIVVFCYIKDSDGQ